jgi:hypothetical protein
MRGLVVSIAAAAASVVFVGMAEAGPPGYFVQASHPGVTIQSPAFLAPNPVVLDSGRYVSGYCAGPRGVRRHVETNQERVHASALDPNRAAVDPGSLVQVDRYVPGPCGWQREQGYYWTSFGVPHSDVNRSRTYRTGIFRTRTDNTHISKETESAPRE